MTMRIGGIASGMDIETMVKDMMKTQRVRVDRLSQTRQLLQWRQERYNDLNKSFANFVLDTRSMFGLTRTTASGTVLNNSVSSLQWVKQATVSDIQVATATARADAVAGTHQVEVTQLASNWSSASGGSITIEGGSKDHVASQLGLDKDDTIDFTITTNKGSVTVNKTNLDKVSIQDIVREINKADIGVKAVYDNSADRFFLQTEQTGEKGTVKIEDNSKLADETPLHFIAGEGSKLKLQHIQDNGTAAQVDNGAVYTGKNAILSLGAAMGIEQTSNQFTINGINFNLKGTGAFSVTVATDVEEVYGKIEEFVNKYNELIEQLDGTLGEKRYRDYRPLTEEQKQAMSDKEAEMWEERARSGLLRNDPILERTLRSMRSGLYEEVKGVDGVFRQLTQIGITTEGFLSGSRGGKLVINREKLTEAIQTDVDSVLELMFKQPSGDLATKNESRMTGGEIQQKRQESGLVRRLYDNIAVGMKDIVSRAGTGDNANLYRNVNSMMLIDFVTEQGSISMLDEENDDLVRRMGDMERQLQRTEDRYWQRFVAMEKALEKMNQQGAWLAQQLMS